MKYYSKEQEKQILRQNRYTEIGWKLKPEFTFHSALRNEQRLGLTEQEIINDIKRNINRFKRGKKDNKSKYLCIGDYAKYIIGKDKNIITILTLEYATLAWLNSKHNLTLSNNLI